MDRSEIDGLVERLVADPHDEEALAYAHREGEADPKSYAQLLERVGSDTRDPAYASHWLSEAANVWSTTLNDVHRAARLLMMAVDKDPTQQVAAERLGALYREKGDTKALVALLDRRAKALAPLVAQQPELRDEMAGMYEEMGRLWAEAPLSQPKKALEAFRRAVELDPRSAYAIYSARELLKQQGQYADAYPLYQAELDIEQDPARRVGLLRDEAATRKLGGDLPGATAALAAAREIDPEDPALQHEYALSVCDRVQGGEAVSADERNYAVDMLVSLAEAYAGEPSLAYTASALDIDAGHDRAMQLFAHFGPGEENREALVKRYRAYLDANPNGAMAPDAQGAIAADAREGRDGGFDALDALEAKPETPAKAEKAAARPRLELAAQSGPLDPPPASSRPAPVPAAQPSPQPVKATPARRSSRDALPVVPPAAASEEDVQPPRRPGPLSADKLQGLLDSAQMLARKNKKPEALVKYREVLEHDPAHPEALAWVEDYLRLKRDYTQLRDVLLLSIRAPGIDRDSRKERLREVAGLCEGNLRDIDGAVNAWRQLLAVDRSDESARSALMRLLEKGQRWDDLATLIEQEANIESDVETKIGLERKLAKLQEEKRKDLVGAGEAWGRIVQLTPDDEHAIQTAAKLFEKAERIDLAARTLAESAPYLEDPIAKGNLLQRLAEFYEQLGDTTAAGDSFAEAADSLRSGKLWEEAERLYTAIESWEKAANAAHQRGLLTGDVKLQAQYHARAAEYLGKVGDEEGALERLEEANNLDPLNDDYATSIVARYNQNDQIDRLVSFLARRGERLNDRAKRVALRREAATLAVSRLEDRELGRELWLRVLEDGDDKEALERLIDDAIDRLDHTEAATLLRRLGANTVDKAERARVALREAGLLAEGVGDLDTAISRYEGILADLDSTCRPALQAIATIQEDRGSLDLAADALERELKLVADVFERGQIAARLARLYEQLDDPRSAIRALDLVRKADPEDFDALTRLSELCEITEQWGRVAELMVERIEVEADESEVSALTMKLAEMLADKLDRGDEALAALTDLADQGDAQVREAYIELGDRLGWKGIVATKLKEWWFDSRHGSDRTAALHGAFERFAEVGRDQDAVSVAIELLRSKGADLELASRLERLAVKTGDHDALGVAHDLLAREVSGADRAHELVRQGEVRVEAGMGRAEAIAHGEGGLSGIAPADAEPLLERLAAFAAKPSDIVDLYERQVSRAKAPTDRVRALARVAQVAAARGQAERARAFLELALAGSPTDETLELVEGSAAEGDRAAGGDRLRRALSQAMATGGHGARDGGRTRGALLRRAARIAHADLHDLDQAFTWLGESLVAHVDVETLDFLEALGVEIGDPRRAEGGLTHALSEVFDGPLVRQLLARRAKIRRELLAEPALAAVDMKRLHDLSPSDQEVLDDLAALLMELGDYRGLVQLYEDQILRGKDMNVRAELARKVARMWEEQLADAREAADAWRRVLRMKAGDEEATGGLERAKSGKLKVADGDAASAYAPPRLPPPPEPRPRLTSASTSSAASSASSPAPSLASPATSTAAFAPRGPRPAGAAAPAKLAALGATTAGLGPAAPPLAPKVPERPRPARASGPRLPQPSAAAPVAAAPEAPATIVPPTDLEALDAGPATPPAPPPGPASATRSPSAPPALPSAPPPIPALDALGDAPDALPDVGWSMPAPAFGESSEDMADRTAILSPAMAASLTSRSDAQPSTPAPASAPDTLDGDIALDALVRSAKPSPPRPGFGAPADSAPARVDFADEVTRDGEEPLVDRSAPALAPAQISAFAAPPLSPLDDLDALVTSKKADEMVGDDEILDVEDHELATSIGRSPLAVDSEDEVIIADDFDDVEMLDDDDVRPPRR
ncbi:MAG: hypothetical protein IPQ09_04810 [Myxococcales bacterium]|nr:hypothetical protein [Myxococcales bacterium]